MIFRWFFISFLEVFVGFPQVFVDFPPRKPMRSAGKLTQTSRTLAKTSGKPSAKPCKAFPSAPVEDQKGQGTKNKKGRKGKKEHTLKNLILVNSILVNLFVFLVITRDHGGYEGRH